MDTKSRKSTNLAKIIIIMCIIVPALFLVSLYPVMESAMLNKRAYYEELDKKEQEENEDWILVDEFVNYAVEASYYIYGDMKNLDPGVFDEYGWINDYRRVRESTSYIATYIPEDGADPIIKKNVDKIDDSIVRFVIEFDSYGNLIEAKISENQSVLQYEGEVYHSVENSKEQFNNNLSVYNDQYEVQLDEETYVPKSFRMEFGLNEYSDFIVAYDDWYGSGWRDLSAERMYYEIGAYWIVAAIFVFIILVAMTLPFFKKLNTGNEKIFSGSFEVMVLVGFLVAIGTYGMGYFMSMTTMTEMQEMIVDGEWVFLGQAISTSALYNFFRVVNFAGWSLLFFMLYVLSANIRQFISDTKYYLKYQTLSVRFFRWIKNSFVKLYHYVTDIDINEKLNKSIIKVVVANFVILTILCCLWVFGVAGLILYSIALFIIIKKQTQKMQKQYHSILSATQQMADGDLKIKLEDDLGIFQPIGESLEKVQQGFEKAVVEEAKSQSMKTELITNVSHDLKTPLTAIITYVDLLKKEDISEEERKSYVKTLDQKSQRLKALIEDLFEVSKANSGNVTMNYMDVDVVSLLKQVKSEMADQIDASSLEFRWNLPEEKVILALDGQRTYRVFENLISNTLKYSMPNSRVYVNLLNEESEVQIIFRNVSAKELDFDPERLTDRFVRGDSSRNSEGSGLGLAIAKSFVELQKGSLKIDVDGDLFKVIITWKK